jgi:Tfp pilus assembly protein PilO
MAQVNPSVKRIMINKANATVVAATSVAAFVIVFCLVSSFMLVGQLSYQNKVISKKKDALTVIKADMESAHDLVNSYQKFANAPLNILGGSTTSSQAGDTTNPTIVLDALPSKYDFPALTTSLEKIMSNDQLTIQGITGTDDETAQAASQSSSTPQPIEMPFQITAKGNYDSVKKLINDLYVSIRPINIQSIEIAASNDNDLTVTIVAKTYYQPEKVLNIRKEEVR